MVPEVTGWVASANPWLACALRFALCTAGLGGCFAWCFAGLVKHDDRRAIRLAVRGFLATLTGLVLSVLTAWLLGESGHYRPVPEAAALGSLALAGVLAGLWRGRARFLAAWRDTWPALFVTFAVAAITMLLPDRSEWIVGGWDPGTYVNEGVAVCREGTFRPGPEPAFADLSAAEMELLLRRELNFSEGFPVFPLDRATGRFEYFFFRLTPSLIAFMARCGELRAAVRVNLFVGLLGLWAFWLAVYGASRSRVLPWFAVACLAMQPVWVYHLSIPTSEMFQFFLLCGTVFLLPYGRQGRAVRWWVHLLFFCLVLNRFSFLPFGMLLLVTDAWADASAGEVSRSSCWIRMQHVAVMLAAACVDYLTVPTTLGRLESMVPALWGTALGLAVVMAGVGGCARSRWGAASVFRALGRAAGPVLCAVALLLGVTTVAPDWALTEDLYFSVRGAVPFLGPVLLLACIPAALGLAWRPAAGRGGALLVFLACSVLATLAMSAIADLFPWALRRHVEYTLPLLAVLAGVGLARVWDAPGGETPLSGPGWRVSRRILALLLLAGLAAAGAKRAWHAWHRTEYNDYSRVIAKIAAQIGPRDLVVVDHFTYGVPLRFMHGRQVVNGEVLWQSRTKAGRSAALVALARYRERGWRVRFLTCTPCGLDYYGVPITPIKRDWTSGPVSYVNLDHHPRADDFVPRKVEHVFQLWTWTPAH